MAQDSASLLEPLHYPFDLNRSKLRGGGYLLILLVLVLLILFLFLLLLVLLLLLPSGPEPLRRNEPVRGEGARAGIGSGRGSGLRAGLREAARWRQL
jgi:hypothetical protein